MDNKSGTGSSSDDSDLVKQSANELVNNVDISDFQSNFSCAGDSVSPMVSCKDPSNTQTQNSFLSVGDVSIQRAKFQSVNCSVANPTQLTVDSFSDDFALSFDMDTNGNTVDSVANNNSHCSTSSIATSDIQDTVPQFVNDTTENMLLSSDKNVNKNLNRTTDLLTSVSSTIKNADAYFLTVIDSTLSSSSDDAIHENIENTACSSKVTNETDKVIVNPEIKSKDGIVTFDTETKDMKEDSITSGIDVKHRETELSELSNVDARPDFFSKFGNRSVGHNVKFSFQKLEFNDGIVKSRDQNSGYGGHRFVTTVGGTQELKLNEGFKSLRHYESGIGGMEVLPKTITASDKSRTTLSKIALQSYHESGSANEDYRENKKSLSSKRDISTEIKSMSFNIKGSVLNTDISKDKNAAAVPMPSHSCNSRTEFNSSCSDIPFCTWYDSFPARLRCTFCSKFVPACIICEDCDIVSCKFCFDHIHSLKGECKNHTVLTDFEGVKENFCQIHNGLYKYYCLNCNKKTCVDCCFQFSSCRNHKVILLRRHISKQREELIQQQRRVSSTCVKNTDAMLSALDQKEDQIQVRWMLEKEMLRQEFVSLYDVITECERSLIQHLEKEVDTSLSRLTDLRRECGDTMESEARLTFETLKLLQDKSDIRFYHERQNIDNRWKKIHEKTERLGSLGYLDPPFLGQKISLFEEKTHIQECLKTENFISMKIRPISHCIYLPKEMLSSPIRASELWQPPASSLPSTEISYKVQIREHIKKIIWESIDPISIDDIVCNGDGKLLLLPMKKYLLKVTPIFKTTINVAVTSVDEGKPCFVLLLTDEVDAMDTNIDDDLTLRSRLNIRGILGLYYSFEERRSLSRSFRGLKTKL